MTADAIARALTGRKVGRGWMAGCPAHDDREPSLSICEGSDGAVLVHCNAGCEQKQVIAVLRSRGLWDEKGRNWFTRLGATGPDQSNHAGRSRSEAALVIWQSATP